MFINFLDKKLFLLILIFCIPLLFLPKFNIVSMDSSETAGIRIDDIILFFTALFIFWVHVISKQKIFKLEGWILLITLFALFSYVSNQILVQMDILHIPAKIFYALRLLEYFFFFYIGIMASKLNMGHQIMTLFFGWNLILMLLQKFQITGAITTLGYEMDASSRVFGVASFPSEMGLILNLLFCYFIFNEDKSSKFYHFFPSTARYILKKFYLPVIFLIFGVLVVLTGNRISILALLVCFLCKFKSEFDWRSLVSWFCLTVLTVFLMGTIIELIMITEAVYERSADLFSWKNFELIKTLWGRVDLSKDALSQGDFLNVDGYDMSWWIRIHKWAFMMKMYVTHPECYLQGLGPGFAGPALDGGILRIITEYGIIGALLFWKFFRSLSLINRQTKFMMLAFGMNMIFFDAYLAYKAMSVLLFTAGSLAKYEVLYGPQQALRAKTS